MRNSTSWSRGVRQTRTLKGSGEPSNHLALAELSMEEAEVGSRDMRDLRSRMRWSGLHEVVAHALRRRDYPRRSAMSALVRSSSGCRGASPICWFPLVVERVHPLVGDRRRRVQFTHGDTRLELDLGEYTQRRIYYRCHEENEVAFVCRFLRRGEAFVDVGANIGFFTVLAAAAVGPSGAVVSIEPFEGSLRALERNVALNGLDNVILEHAAVTDTAGTMTLDSTRPASPTVTGAGSLKKAASSGSQSGRSLSTIFSAGRLDDRAIRLVKIDVEGLEPRVLAGSAQLLAGRPPDAVLIELNKAALEQQGYREDDVLEPLRAAGYSLHEVGLRGRLRPFRAGSPATGSALLGPLRDNYRSWRSLRNVVAMGPRGAA